MTNWLEAAFGVGDEAEPIASQPRHAPEIKSFICVVEQPMGAPGDLGRTVDCYYLVTDGVVRLCDQNGKGDGKSQVLAVGDDPRRIASRLRRAAWQSESGRTAFDRPLHYRPLGWA